MLEVGDEHEVHVGDHPGKNKEVDHRQHAEDTHAVEEQTQAAEEGDVRLHDQPVLLGLEEDRGGREVVHVLSTVLGRSGGSEDQVAWHPAHRQHEEDAPEVGDGRLAKHLLAPVGARRGSEDLVIRT